MVHYELPMDSVLPGGHVVNPSGLDARLTGRTTFVDGPRHRALLVDGRSSFIRVTGPGHRHECFGDLHNCPDGMSGDGNKAHFTLEIFISKVCLAFEIKISSVKRA